MAGPRNRRCPPGHAWVPWLRQCRRRKKKPLGASADDLQRALGVARAVKARFGMLAEAIKEGKHGES